LSELLGLGLLVLSLFTLISLVGFYESDPSLNMAADHPVRNWAGLPGAYLANPLLETLGLASLLVVTMMAAWGWRLFKSKRTPNFMSLRIAMFFTSLVLLAAIFAVIEPPISWPIENGLGGAIGMLVRRSFSHHFASHIYAPVFLLMLCITVPVALGLTFGEWKAILRLSWKSIILMLTTLSILRPAKAEDLAYAGKPKSLLKKIARKKKLEDESDDEWAGEDLKAPKKEMKKDLVVPPKPKAQPKIAQSSLELRPRKGQYQLPPVSLLSEPGKRVKKQQLNESALSQNARLLETVLNDFGINGEVVKVRPGPVVTLYELEPSPGTKSSRVIGLADDIARSMSAVSARIATVPGRNVIGIELPNQTRETVLLRELIEDDEFTNTSANLPIALGKDIGGTPIVVDLARMPHVLVAGTTGSGKSVAINTMIASLLYKLTPEQCKFIMIDPKMLELSVYDNIPHLLSPVVTEPGKAVVALKWTVREMENRYRLMSSLGVRNIEGYNKRIHDAKAKGDKLTRTVQTGFNPDTGTPIIEEVALDMTPLPFIVVIVDEMADLMLIAGKEIESSIQRLAQMARAAGIHIIMATQRPSVDVITGVIKANFPTRVSFQVTSRIDSRTILNEQGAEQLLGQGDMLYMAGGGRITRVHGPFITDKEVEQVVAHARAQGAPIYIEEVTRDVEEELALAGGGEDEGDDADIYRQAVAIVLRDRKASTSYLQRKREVIG
jgi:S-DNA-T family DNA segregation ATPase FtsK/SpoIIIE